jgi:predicted transposase YdaD
VLPLAEYDLIIKALAARYMDKIASFVRGVPVSVEQIEDKDKEAVAVQRTSDALVKVRENGYEYLMLLEFQARPDRKMASRLLEYTAMHHRRHGKPVYPVVINLTGGGRREESYTVDCLDLTVVDFNYRMINLEDVAGRDLLYRGPVGLLPLAPLMRQEEPPEAVLGKCAERIGREVEAEDEKDILYLALVAMSSLRFPKDLILKVLEVSRLENLPLFDGIREEWESKGVEKGLEKGRIEGRDEGIIDAIMEAVEENTGRRPGWLKERLSGIRDSDLLKKILRRAVKAKTFEEFEMVFIDLKSN